MKKYFSITLYILACLFGLIYIINEITPNVVLSEFSRLFLLGGSCLFLYFGGYFLSKVKGNNKPMKINLWIFFGLYLFLLITLTLFDSMWGRNGLTFINWFSDEFRYFIKHSVNLIPFKTIIEFIKEFNSMYSSRTILLNLLGNFIALMPMAFFLPLLFKKQDKFKNFFLTILLIILGIELCQLLTASGRFDIDDIILNASGAILMYFVLRIKVMQNLIKNIFLSEKNKISKKSYIIIIIAIFLALISIILLVDFRNILYNINYNEYNKIHNPIISIIDESQDTCDQVLELFYTDELYDYYFPCRKSDKVYVLVNNEEKYLLKDFLKNKKYNYSIDILLQRNDKITYIKENKYQYITLSVKVPVQTDGSMISPNIYLTIANEDILDAKYEYENDFEQATYKYNIHLIPKKEGTTNIDIIFKDYNNNLLESFNYSIKVDEELSVEYEELK